MSKKLLTVRIVDLGGRLGDPGEYIAIVRPYYFKNGNLKKTKFSVVQILYRFIKYYVPWKCDYVARIAEVLGDVTEFMDKNGLYYIMNNNGGGKCVLHCYQNIRVTVCKCNTERYAKIALSKYCGGLPKEIERGW